ncbi:MAG: glycosyltransferase family 4 protein [Planctomycetes bacterium]|nr:glycosyltransferase family 4 protein [Planctomycetota bacterium]
MSLHVLVSAVVLAQPMGGVRRHSAELLPRAARILEESGGSLSVLVGREGLPFALPDSVRRIESRVPSHPVLVRATLEGRALRRAVAEARAAARPYDVVHLAHLPVPRGIAAARSHTIHDLRALELEHTPLSRRLVAQKLIGAALETAAVVITVSEQVRGRVLERFRLDPARVRVVPNAADHFEPLPRRVLADAPILHVGHLEPRKNLGLLLRALALDPTLPRLLLAGLSKQGEDARLFGLAEELGVQGRVEFLGPFEDRDLPGLYAGAACVALPSRLEGFGIPALEAQCAGAPLAVSRTGALLEVAGDVPAFSPDDPAECARALRAAIATAPRELDAARLRGQRFRWDASAAALVAAWRAAAPGPGRDGA